MSEHDEKYYGRAAAELKSGDYDQDLAAKAFTLANGNKDAARAVYIKPRVAHWKTAEPKVSALQRKVTLGHFFAYVAWFFVWFILFSFIYVPLRKETTDAFTVFIESGINIAVLIYGFIAIGSRFAKKRKG